jgi:hypothetical protein
MRGLREVEPAEAAVVRRILTDYAAGASPRTIARRPNAEGVPGPGGGIWNDDTIRGRGRRTEGILRNPLYDGRFLRNRRKNKKRPDTGSRAREERDRLIVPTDHLRLVDPALRQAMQDRLAANAATARPESGPGLPGYWGRRRPRYLLTRKTFCGLCGSSLYTVGKDYLTWSASRNGACPGRFFIRRDVLTERVVGMMRTFLMPPELVAAFVETYREAWRTQASEAIAEIDPSSTSSPTPSPTATPPRHPRPS